MAHAPTVLDPEHKWCAPPGATAEEEARIEAELQEQADALIEKEVKRAYELYGDKATDPYAEMHPHTDLIRKAREPPLRKALRRASARHRTARHRKTCQRNATMPP